MGRTSSAQSLTILGTALPMEKAYTFTLQVGLVLLSQKPWTGLHWKIVVMTCENFRVRKGYFKVGSGKLTAPKGPSIIMLI